MTVTYLEEHAKEKGTYIAVVTFRDPDQALVVPTAATWTLTDIGGAVINSKSAVAITPLASASNLVLSGDDLPVRANNELVILVEGTFNSVTYGNNLPIKDEVHFFVDDLIKVAN